MDDGPWIMDHGGLRGKDGGGRAWMGGHGAKSIQKRDDGRLLTNLCVERREEKE